MSDTAYPVYQHYGTTAQRGAFTPAPPSTGQPIYIWFETDTGNAYLYDTSWHQILTSSGGMTKIAETILGSDTATITLSSIPATYRHLQLTLVARNDNAGTGATDGYIQFNGDTAANYSRSFGFWKGTGAAGTGYGTGENISAAKCPAFFAINNGATANLATVITTTIYDYARTTWKKTCTSIMAIPLDISSGNLQGNTISFNWNSTAAINAILIGMTDTSKLKTGTVASLYGIP